MKIKCRILSIFATAILSIITLVSIVIIARKEDNTTIYAESINFVDSIRSAEIFIDNKLILNDSLVCIEPDNCTLKPEFVVKKYGSNNEELITDGSYSFPSTGRYTVYCQVKSSENYYKKDNMNLTVVDTPSSTTAMYINPDESITMYNDDEIELSSIVHTHCPSVANMKVTCSEHLNVEDNIITALKEGVGTIDITLSYHNLVINQSFSVVIKPKTVESDIRLKLYSTKPIEDVITINSLECELELCYELLNVDSQQINCWTDSDIFEITSHSAPIITLNPKCSGEAILYISPIDYEDVIFEVVVRIT